MAADLNTHLRDNLNMTAPAVMSAQGDIVIASGANTPIRLAKSTTSTQYLANTGTSNAPAWNEVALATGISGVLPVANGGVGVALSAPGADRILFWDHSATAYAYLTAGTNLTISGTTMVADGITNPITLANLDLASYLLVGNGGSTGIAIDSVGAVNMAAQPAFLAILNTTDSNVTGGGSTYTLGGGNALVEVFDQGGDFGTATFTAPITGRYLLSFGMRLGGLATNQTVQEANIITSNRTYRYRNDLAGAGVTNSQAFGTVVADMDLNDTVTIALTMSGGSDVVDVETNSAASYFAGALLV